MIVRCPSPCRRGISRNAGSGFTLLEVLVAVAVLGVSLVRLLALHARNVNLAAETHDLTVAGLLARKVVVLTKVGPFPSVGELDGKFSQSRERSRNSQLAELGDEVYGGPLSEDFVWSRKVKGLAQLNNVRAVTIEVGRDDDEAIVEFTFAVWRGGL